jgi:hypothetical protein
MDFKLNVAAVSATPALQALINSCEPRRLAETLRDPFVKLVRDNYLAQRPNKMGAPSTGYWRSAAESTYAVTSEDGLTITTDKIGVRQHLYGGPIYPVNAQFLSIPACIEAHGKLPRDFDDLVVIRFGRGQCAPVALIKAADADFVRNAPDCETAATKFMFKLVRAVNQKPEPNVLPSDDQFADAVETAIIGSMPK